MNDRPTDDELPERLEAMVAGTGWSGEADDLRAAAARIRELEACPRCGSTDPDERRMVSPDIGLSVLCGDDWHDRTTDDLPAARIRDLEAENARLKREAEMREDDLHAAYEAGDALADAAGRSAVLNGDYFDKVRIALDAWENR